MYIASLARWDTQLKGLAELERRCQDPMQEVKLLSEKQGVLVGIGGEEEGHAEISTQEVSREDFRGVQGVRGANGKRSPGTRAKEAYAHKVGSRKGKSKNAAKIGRIEGDVALTLKTTCLLSRALLPDVEELCSKLSRKVQDKEETTSEPS